MLRFIFILLLFTGIFSCNHLLGNTFQNFNCDTISKPDIGPDTSICEGIILLLKNQFETPNATYLWSDGKTTSTIDVTKAGAYWLENILVSSAKAYKYTAIKGLCELRSEINVREINIPNPAIGDYIDKCRGEVQNLSVPSFSGAYYSPLRDKTKLQIKFCNYAHARQGIRHKEIHRCGETPDH